MNERSMYKKIFILTVCTLGVFIILGCAANSEHVQTVSQKKEQTVNMPEETDSKENQKKLLFHDLVYKEYTVGSNMPQGKIMIKKDRILQTAEAPKSVVIYYNDEVLTKLPFVDKDITFDLERSGYYVFFVCDENDKLTELSAGEIHAICDDAVRIM